MDFKKIRSFVLPEKKPFGKKEKIILGIRIVAVAVLFFLMWYLCHNFMDYQKNATSQVNKYRVDQVCMLSDGSMVVQKFEAKHTHLKTVKLYFSNDYSGVATGKLILNIVDMETGKSVAKVSRKISNLKDFDYTDFNTDVQLQKGNHYAIQISTVGTESGKEPIVYQWSTRETGFEGKLQVNRVEQQKYLVAQFYYPVTIYQQWLGICVLLGLVILLVLFPIPVPEKGKAAFGYLLFYAAPMFTFAPLTPMIKITEVRIRFCALL